MRTPSILAAAAIFFAIGPWPLAQPLTPPPVTTLSARAVPVALDPADPKRTRFGDLELLEAWAISSPHEGFGGWSALAMTGTRQFIAASDSGWIGRFGLSATGAIEDLAIATLPGQAGDLSLHKRYRDVEALARTADGQWLASVESRREIRRYSPGFDREIGVARPKMMQRWRSNTGAEALVPLAGGRWLAISERGASAESSPESSAESSDVLLFDRAPDRADAIIERYDYDRAGMGGVADALSLPDGRIVILHRRFSLRDRFSATIAIADPREIAIGKPWTSRSLGTLAPPLLADNFEGLALDPDPDCRCIWIISDDNKSVWQRTLLIRVRLPPAEPAPAESQARKKRRR